MAINTRFISTSSSPVATGANIDIGAATAAASANERAVANTNQALQSLGASIDAKVSQQEKPDELYLAQSNGDFQIRYNDAFLKQAGAVKPNEDLPGQVNQTFSSMAKEYIENAPNDATRAALVKSFSKLQTQAVKKAQGIQFKSNENYQVDRFSDFATNSAALAASGVAGEEATYASIEQQAAAAMEKGFNVEKIQAAAKQAKDQVFLSSRLTDASKNPFEVLKAAKSGMYASAGLGTQQKIIAAAEENIGGQVIKYSSDMDNLKKSLIAGLNPGPDSVDVLKQAADLVGNDWGEKYANKKQDLVNSVAANAQLMEFQESIKAFNRDELQLKSQALTTSFSQGLLPLDLFTAQNSMLSNRIKRIEEDPLAHYAANSVSDGPVAMPPAGTKIDSAEWKNFVANRLRISEKAEATLQTTVPPIYKAEVDNTLSRWGTLTYKEKEQQLQMLGSFGPKASNQIAAMVSGQAEKLGAGKGKKELTALPTIIRLMGQKDGLSPQLAADILKGSEKLSEGNFSFQGEDHSVISAAASSAFGKLFMDEPKRKAEIVEAAKALIAENSVKEGVQPGKLDEDKVRQAIERVSGIGDSPLQLGVFGGATEKMIMPRPDITSEDMKTFASYISGTNYGDPTSPLEEGLTFSDMSAFGNGTPEVIGIDRTRKPFNMEDLDDYQYRYVSDGSYMLVQGNKYVTTIIDGKEVPYQINLKALMDVKKPLIGK